MPYDTLGGTHMQTTWNEKNFKILPQWEKIKTNTKTIDTFGEVPSKVVFCCWPEFPLARGLLL